MGPSTSIHNNRLKSHLHHSISSAVHHPNRVLPAHLNLSIPLSRARSESSVRRLSNNMLYSTFLVAATAFTGFVSAQSSSSTQSSSGAQTTGAVNQTGTQTDQTGDDGDGQYTELVWRPDHRRSQPDWYPDRPDWRRWRWPVHRARLAPRPPAQSTRLVPRPTRLATMEMASP